MKNAKCKLSIFCSIQPTDCECRGSHSPSNLVFCRSDLWNWVMMTPCSGGLGGSLTQSLLSPPCGIKGCPLWHVNVWQLAECCCQPGKFTWVLVGLRFISMNDWLVGRRLNEISSPAPSSPEVRLTSSGSKPQPSNTWAQRSARAFLITQDLTTKQSF